MGRKAAYQIMCRHEIVVAQDGAIWLRYRHYQAYERLRWGTIPGVAILAMYKVELSHEQAPIIYTSE